MADGPAPSADGMPADLRLVQSSTYVAQLRGVS